MIPRAVITFTTFVLMSSAATSFSMAGGEELPNAVINSSVIIRNGNTISNSFKLTSALPSENNFTSENTVNNPSQVVEKLDVVASVSPITNIIKNIGGDR